MAITYDQQQRDTAKDRKLPLITIDAYGMSFQGPVDWEEQKELEKYLIAFMDRRSLKLRESKVAHAQKTDR